MDISVIPLQDRTLVKVMERALHSCEAIPAAADPTRSVTYGEAWSEALRIAGGLERHGVRFGQRVSLMLDNHVDNVLTWLGLGLTGRLEVSINTAYHGAMLSYLVTNAETEVMVLELHYLAALVDVAAQMPSLRTVVLRGWRAETHDVVVRRAMRWWNVIAYSELRDGKPASPAKLTPWDLASLSYTSGTTGRSKGVICPHAHAFGHATNDGLGTTNAGEVRLVALPQFHIAGRWGGVYHALVHQATAWIAPRFSASQFWHQARDVDARTTQLVGTMAEFLQRQPESTLDREHGIREICIIPVNSSLERWGDRFGVKITTCYGSTELGAVMSGNHINGSCVGQVREGYEVRIVDEHDMEVPYGTIGEAIVRPAKPWTTSTGYHDQPEATAAAWRNGWLHGGDALYRDEDGNHFFVDRLDDTIRRRGENISSQELESFVNAHPAVAESAAIAIASDVIEDDIKIVVVLNPGERLLECELIAFLERDMPSFMVPRYVQFVSELPKTATSKIRKKELRQVGFEGCWDRDRQTATARTM